MIRNKNTVLIGYCTFLSVQNTELIYYIIGLDIKLWDRWSIIFIPLSHFVLCLVFLLSQWNYYAAKLKWPVKHNSTFSFLLCSVLFLLFPCFLDSSFSPFLYSILPFSPLLSSPLVWTPSYCIDQEKLPVCLSLKWRKLPISLFTCSIFSQSHQVSQTLWKVI